MAFSATYNTVFNVFLERQIGPFFEKKILNQLTGKELDRPSHIPLNTSAGVHLAMDTSGYFNLQTSPLGKEFQKKTIRQYPGFLVNLNTVATIDEYLRNQLSKRNRKNLRSKTNALERDGDITYRYFFGEMERGHYDFLFERFYDFQKTRFEQKKIYNRYLTDWQSLYDSVYPLIIGKKVYLFVMYDGEKPIAFTLNYLFGDIAFSHMQSYDISYSKFNLGDICMVKNLEWCIAHKIDIFDMSIAKNAYKEKWCNHIYYFYHHIFFKSNSLIFKQIANILYLKYKSIQFLRDKQIIGHKIKLDQLKYYWYRKKLKNQTWVKNNT